MERWAKVQNTQKESAMSSFGFKKPLAPISAVVKSKDSAAADAGFAVLSKVEHMFCELVIDYWPHTGFGVLMRPGSFVDFGAI